MLNETSLKKGDLIHHVRNTQLAAALVTVGVPLRKDPPYMTVKLRSGEAITTYNFESCTPDRELSTGLLIKAWKDSARFIQANPQHPFTFAMLAVKNFVQMTEHINGDTPFVVYKPRNGQMRYLVKQGSKKEAALIKQRFIQL